MCTCSLISSHFYIDVNDIACRGTQIDNQHYETRYINNSKKINVKIVSEIQNKPPSLMNDVYVPEIQVAKMIQHNIM